MQAILYAAKSTEDKRGSIPTQLEDCRKMAEREGWEVVEEYSDEAASAWSDDRGPNLAAAMEHAERIGATLIVQHSDRLARGDGVQARHLVEIALWAIKAEVTIRSVQDPQTFENLLMAVVMGERNTEDSRRKSLAVKSGHQRRAERGTHNGGRTPPYGYSFGKEKTLEIIRHQAEIVRRIFSEFVSGKSQTAISRDLQREGVPTARGGKWRGSTVGGILDNPVYIGKVRHNGESFSGRHEAIIDETTWQRAADLLGASPERRGRPPKGRHLFRSGLLRCGQCGEAMVPRTRPDWEYYYCNGRSTFGREFCDGPNIGRDVIDTAVYTYFEKIGLDVEATRQQLAESRDRKLEEVRASRGQAERETGSLRDQAKRVERDYRSGELSVPNYERISAEIAEELEAANAEAERLQKQEQKVTDWGELRDVQADMLRKLADLRRAIAGEIQDAGRRCHQGGAHANVRGLRTPPGRCAGRDRCAGS
jgi:site-specific DNA recombinase